MFENQKVKRNLMIVYDEKLKVYADFLIALIGQNDDNEETVIGTKDGTVVAALFESKVYNDNLPTITSNTHVLFIKGRKETEKDIKNLISKFNKYGMYYGWRGKRAVMYVNHKMLEWSEYKQFVGLSRNYHNRLEKKNLDKVNAVFSDKKSIDVISSVVYTLGTKDLIKGYKLRKEIRNQQYRCLTIALYLDGLQKFLEN